MFYITHFEVHMVKDRIGQSDIVSGAKKAFYRGYTIL